MADISGNTGAHARLSALVRTIPMRSIFLGTIAIACMQRKPEPGLRFVTSGESYDGGARRSTNNCLLRLHNVNPIPAGLGRVLHELQYSIHENLRRAIVRKVGEHFSKPAGRLVPVLRAIRLHRVVVPG
jgi:hypothetical protein